MLNFFFILFLEESKPGATLIFNHFAMEVVSTSRNTSLEKRCVAIKVTAAKEATLKDISQSWTPDFHIGWWLYSNLNLSNYNFFFSKLLSLCSRHKTGETWRKSKDGRRRTWQRGSFPFFLAFPPPLFLSSLRLQPRLKCFQYTSLCFNFLIFNVPSTRTTWNF